MNRWLDVENLLVVRLDNAGDVVMLGPALRAIKQNVPECRLTLLATTSGDAIAPYLPWIDDRIVWRPIWQELRHPPEEPARDLRLIADIAARGFDAAIIFTSFKQDPHVPGYVCYLAGVPLRAGESKEFGGATFTDELPSLLDELHQVERNLRLIERLGFRVCDRSLSISLSSSDRAAVNPVLRDAGIDVDKPFVVVHPGASAPARRYPISRYAEIVRMLRVRGLQVAVTGSNKERDLLLHLSTSSGIGLLDTESKTRVLAAVIERALAVICGNTLPMHLADAVHTPAVVLYSGTDLEAQWRPRNIPFRTLRRDTQCHPCYLIDCPIGQPCLDIPPEEVIEALSELVALPQLQHGAVPA